ncbi:hypothetical protein QQF64_012050 [Cirrhinus molitorella]|uniref:Gag protein n=1 Tax=Cirrhinus molitorella TaxID=172907 RepID=A0ABR3LUC9_9TELE
MIKKYVPYRTYQPATPQQVDKWTKELPDVYKQPRKVWQFLQCLQKIYTLHPLDGAMIVNVNLRDNNQKRLTESVERKIGESQENIEEGWEAVQTFLLKLKPAEVNWSKITSCMQKTGESVVEFEERFRQTWLEYSVDSQAKTDSAKCCGAAGKLMNLSLQHQLATSHPKTDGLHVYANKTSEDTMQKEKACTETSTTEAKDDVLVSSAAQQAVKERGVPVFQKMSKDIQHLHCTALAT